MSMYDRLAGLGLSIDGYDLRTHERDVSSGFTRRTTIFELRGGGEHGRGEDVCYDTADHAALWAWDARGDGEGSFPFAGEYTFETFSRHLDDVDLFPAQDPERATAHDYRRWAVESAALDLALKQADADLASALGRTYDPVNFVVSTRLGDPPTIDRVRSWLAHYPDLGFKLDPTPEWDRALIDDIAATGAVEILDLKGLYEGTGVDTESDPDFYGRVLAGFPDAVIEDPNLTEDTRPLFAGHEDRVSWDYPIHGVADVEALPFEPAWLNVKPSRFGTVRSLLETIAYARERSVRLYAGGQFELGVGREHLHALASLFYPDAPNDAAPSAYNEGDPRPGLPGRPLDPPADPRGLDWH